MNFQGIKQSNPFVFNALTDKIRSHLQINKINQEKIQKNSLQNKITSFNQPHTNRQNNTEKQISEADVNYNAIQQAIVNRLKPKLESQHIDKHKDTIEEPQKTQEEQPKQEKQASFNHQFLKKSIQWVFLKNNQKRQKQAKQAKQAKQIKPANKQIDQQNTNNAQPSQLHPNQEKLAEKKPVQIIEIISDSSQQGEDQLFDRKKIDFHKNKRPSSKKSKSILSDQQTFKELNKDTNLPSKFVNKYPNININQIRNKIFKSSNNTNTEPSQQNQESLIRPQIQIKKPYRKQSNPHDTKRKYNDYEDMKPETVIAPFTSQYARQMQDEQRAVNKYNEQMLKGTKLAQKSSFNPKIKPERNQPFTDFYIHIDLLPEKEVDMAKINQVNQSNQENHPHSNYSHFKPIKPQQQPTKYISDKYRQQRIQEYFGVKEKKSFTNKINDQIQKANVIDKNPQQLYNAKKSSKHLFSHPQNQLKLQNNDYEFFVQRRIKKKGSLHDLGVLTIDQIVQQCYIKGIIGEEMYVQYINQSSREKIKEFINNFIERKLNQWNFNEIKITLMDHRRLSELLVNLYPKEYIIYSPYSIQKDINDFLTNLYILSNSDYKSLLESLDSISGITFWKTFKIKYQRYLNIPVKVIPYTPKNIQKDKQFQYEQYFSPARRTQEQVYTAAEKEMIQRYNQEKDNKKIYTKRPRHFEYQKYTYSSASSSSSNLSPETNSNKYGIKKPNKNGMQSRKRIH